MLIMDHIGRVLGITREFALRAIANVAKMQSPWPHAGLSGQVNNKIGEGPLGPLPLLIAGGST